MAGVALPPAAPRIGDPVMSRATRAVRLWFDSWEAEASVDDRIDWIRVLPFVGMHLACLAVFWVGVSMEALFVGVALFLLRMFAITAFYHRYFSHRSFRTSRVLQFLFAVVGASAVQRGPLWWASHHRRHHRGSDTAEDAHSPRHGFWNSHMGWFLNRRNLRTRTEEVKDLMRFPELVWLDRFDLAVPFLLASACLLIGVDVLVFGFFVSTVALYHATFTINSLAHRFGSRRYQTRDDSRNSMLLALLTFGEGWHNNHHRYPGSVRQGFRWWEVDLSYYLLRLMASLRLVWDLRPVPKRILEVGR